MKILKKINNMPMFIKHFFSIGIMVVGVFLTPLAYAQTFEASVDRDEVMLDETLTLALRFSGKDRGEPDFSPLEKAFVIVQKRQSNMTQYSNGKFNAYRQWDLTLQPKQAGKLIVPALTLGSEVSEAIMINVSKPVFKKSNSTEDLFFETLINSDEVYVQQQVLLTYKLYYRVNIDVAQHSLDSLNMDSIMIEDLEGESYRADVNGRQFNVQEITFAIYPQESGELTIPAIEWVIRTNLSFSKYNVKRLLTEEKKIQVKPVPVSFPVGEVWLPSPNVTFDDSWTPKETKLNTGDPVTRTLTLRAEGLMKSQLPSFNLDQNIDQYSIYPQTPAAEQEVSSKGITAMKRQEAAIVINAPGEIALPEVRIPWWNTQTDSLEYATAPGRTFSVTASTDLIRQQNAQDAGLFDENNAPIGSVNNKPAKWLLFWQLLSLGLFIVCAALAFLWRSAVSSKDTKASKANQTNESTAGVKSALRQLKSACDNSDAIAARKATIVWAKAYCNEPNIHSLEQIKALVGDKELSTACENLDASLFSSQTQQWQGKKLYEVIDRLSQTKNKHSKENDALSALYPT